LGAKFIRGEGRLGSTVMRDRLADEKKSDQHEKNHTDVSHGGEIQKALAGNEH